MRLVPFTETLRTTNEGKLELFFLGTGSAFVKKNFQNNMLIIKGNQHVLVDCGTRCPEAFTHYNSNVLKIQNMLLTHSHSDHIGGVEEVALMHHYGTKDRVNLIITDEYKELLWNESLCGGLCYGERLTGLNLPEPKGGRLCFEDYFIQLTPKQMKDTPRPCYEITLGDLNIKMFRTRHASDVCPGWEGNMWSTGLLIDDRVLFTSDTRFDVELLDWMERDYQPEIILHDCQPFVGGVHTGLDELVTLPEHLKKKTYICHYADTYTEKNLEGTGLAGMVKPGIYYQFD